MLSVSDRQKGMRCSAAARREAHRSDARPQVEERLIKASRHGHIVRKTTPQHTCVQAATKHRHEHTKRRCTANVSSTLQNCRLLPKPSADNARAAPETQIMARPLQTHNLTRDHTTQQSLERKQIGAAVDDSDCLSVVDYAAPGCRIQPNMILIIHSTHCSCMQSTIAHQSITQTWPISCHALQCPTKQRVAVAVARREATQGKACTGPAAITSMCISESV